MATIYDVAKKAGTSISTVSHYLNKTKYVGPDKSKRVQEAIDTLGYVPSRAAKSLKTKHSSEIHVALPNISDPYYAHTYAGISRRYLESDYAVILHLTDDIPSMEQAVINKILKSDPAGIILCTCAPNAPYIKTLIGHEQTVFIYRIPESDKTAVSMVYDNETAVFGMVKELLSSGHTSIGLITGPSGFSNEIASIDGYEKALQLYGPKNIDEKLHQHHLPHQKEEALRYLYLEYEDKPLPDCFIATSRTFVSAINDIYAVNNRKCEQLVVFGYESWVSKDLTMTTIPTIRACDQLGFEAADKLEKMIENPNSVEKRTYVYQDGYDANLLKKKDNHIPKKETETTLKLLMLDDALSVGAIRSLSPHLKANYGIDIQIDTKPYAELFATIDSLKDDATYDLFSIDMPWLNEMVRNNRIIPLDAHINESHMTDTTGNFTYPTRLGLSNQNLYGIPYLIGLQMVFYRKDLFADRHLREAYYETYNMELEPPTNWHEYNQIAKFFSKKYNKQSPTTYGTCLADYFKGSILGEILPRIWAYDGQILSKDNMPCMCTPQVKQAFENYVQATTFGTTDTPHYAEDVAKLFTQKDIAMITSYVSYAPILYDRQRSNVNGLVDFAPMPSDSSMVSGWSLCVNQLSNKKEEAISFLKWFLSIDVACRYALITGNPTMQQLYNNASLKKLYPWLPLAMETFEKGHTRKIIGDNQKLDDIRDTLESMVAGIIYRHQSSRSSLHSLLKQADRDLLKMLRI